MKADYKELCAQLDALTKKVEAARVAEHKAAVSTCKELIAIFGLTAYDLGLIKTQQIPAMKVKKSDATFKPKAPRVVYPPKYVNPADGRTWSGRGHQPSWIQGNKDDYLIKEYNYTVN